VNEHRLSVTRSARYFTLGESVGVPRLREIWIACHGYGHLAARFLRNFDGLDDGTRIIAAPEALNRFYLDPVVRHHGPDAAIGATWMTREDREHEIHDYVGYLDAVAADLLAGHDRASVRLVAFGFSQGVSTVARWVALGGTRVGRVILWAGGLPEDIVLAEHRDRFGTEPVTYAVGDADEYLNAGLVARQQARLRDAGIPVAFVPFVGGHTVDRAVLARIAGGAAGP
jgi:predicted esterase